MGIFSKTVVETPKEKETKKVKDLKSQVEYTEEKLEKKKLEYNELKEAHEKLKAMTLKQLIEKYVCRFEVVDKRTGDTIVDSSAGIVSIDDDNWLSCSDTELKVNFVEGYELTLRVEKEGDC